MNVFRGTQCLLVCALVLVLGGRASDAQSHVDAANAESFFTDFKQAITSAKREISFAPSVPERFPEKWYPAADTSPEVPGPVTGKPFQSIEVTTYYYVGPDGKEMPHDQGETKIRDSAGRTRTEGITGGGNDGEVTYLEKFIQISDPVAHCRFLWSVRVPTEAMPDEGKVAFVQCLPRKLTYIDLDMEGLVLAEIRQGAGAIALSGSVNGENYIGLRTKNSAAGADHSQDCGTETWYSTDLRLTLARFDLRGDPQDGCTRSQTLAQTGLKRIEPDATLFYPPADYSIRVEESKWFPRRQE